MTASSAILSATARVRALPADRRFGRVVGVRGATIEIGGLGASVSVGARLGIADGRGGTVAAEVTALNRDQVAAMPFADATGIAGGARADLLAPAMSVRPGEGWLGRVVNALGEPADGRGPLPGGEPRAVRSLPPPATERARVGARVETGVAALDAFAPLCVGQRLGLFAGSGVGKSTLMSMLARWTACDVAVIGLIGERGREVTEFVEDSLGPDGLARSVVVSATSDEPAIVRRQAAWTTLAVAEHFRDRGAHVLLLMDSVTRFAMAQREIGLASGEPPATRGYTPSVFAELPRLLERAGPGPHGTGSITALFTVLVDGDDHNEPVADAVRGILDGHIVMSRRIAERGRFPAVDVLRSVSRTLPGALAPEQNRARMAARAALALHEDMDEMVRLGAYKAGSNAEVDRAVQLAPRIEALLGQDGTHRQDGGDLFDALTSLVDSPA